MRDVWVTVGSFNGVVKKIEEEHIQRKLKFALDRDLFLFLNLGKKLRKNLRKNCDPAHEVRVQSPLVKFAKKLRPSARSARAVPPCKICEKNIEPAHAVRVQYPLVNFEKK